MSPLPGQDEDKGQSGFRQNYRQGQDEDRGQSGFRKNYRTSDNNFVLRSLIEKQKQARQKGGSGKLYCCFVDFKKAFDTVPRALLWQVLEDLGVQGRVLDIIKSMYAHDSAAVRTSEGLSEIFRCLM